VKARAVFQQYQREAMERKELLRNEGRKTHNNSKTKLIQEVLGRSIRLLSLDTTRTAQKTKKLVGIQTPK
jgi:hypothetical protein